jgi:hypothetical protein
MSLTPMAQWQSESSSKLDEFLINSANASHKDRPKFAQKYDCDPSEFFSIVGVWSMQESIPEPTWQKDHCKLSRWTEASLYNNHKVLMSASRFPLWGYGPKNGS